MNSLIPERKKTSAFCGGCNSYPIRKPFFPSHSPKKLFFRPCLVDALDHIGRGGDGGIAKVLFLGLGLPLLPSARLFVGHQSLPANFCPGGFCALIVYAEVGHTQTHFLRFFFKFWQNCASLCPPQFFSRYCVLYRSLRVLVAAPLSCILQDTALQMHKAARGQEEESRLVVLTVLEELYRRNALRIALNGRTDAQLQPLLRFLSEVILDPRCACPRPLQAGVVISNGWFGVFQDCRLCPQAALCCSGTFAPTPTDAPTTSTDSPNSCSQSQHPQHCPFPWTTRQAMPSHFGLPATGTAPSWPPCWRS